MKANLRRFTGSLFIGLLALALATVLPAAEGGKPKAPKADKSGADAEKEDLFAAPKVYRLSIELSALAQESLRREPKTYVKATLREGGQTLTNVALRLKGNGSFEGLDKKPSLALKFNEFVPGQKLFGHTKVLLNNSRQDSTFLCETMGGEIFRAAGVPAARTTFARVELNGRDVGLYVITEAANRDFLARFFKKAKGNLYEGSNNDVTDKLEKDSGDESTDQSDLKALASAAKTADPAQRWKKLETNLDVDRFLSFAAAEVLTWHRDGYSMDRNNYRLYHDPASSQMVFLPHGLDLLFNEANGPLVPEWKGLVAKAVFETPEGQRRYRERMARLLAEGCTTEKLLALLADYAARIRPAVGDRDSAATKDFDAALGRLREQITKRVAFLQEQLKNPAAAK